MLVDEVFLLNERLVIRCIAVHLLVCCLQLLEQYDNLSRTVPTNY